jgi:hypothetical protein
MFLLGWKEKTEVVGKEPIFLPLYSAPTACAASSRTAMHGHDSLRPAGDLLLDLFHADVQGGRVDVG